MSEDIYHLDYESKSKSDLLDVGHYRYAEDESTRILMFGIAKGDGPVLMWNYLEPDTEESMEALGMFQTAIDTKAIIKAHNAPFELAVTTYRGRKDLGLDELPDIHQWRCVLAMCRKAALPVSLAAAGKTLRVEEMKDARGKGLMTIFSFLDKEKTLHAPEDFKIYDKSSKGRRAPNRKSFDPLAGWTDSDGTHHVEILWDWLVQADGEEITLREAWRKYIEYCRTDVKVERLVDKKLQHFELTGQTLKSFQFNLKMNDRGIPVNVTALETAQRLITQYEKLTHVRFGNMTGLRPSQNQKFKAWMQERGYMEDNLQAETVEKFLEDYDDFLTKEGLAALTLYRLLNFAALAKVPAMLRAANKDGKVRGTMFWHGARTGRATGKIIQPQNMKKAKEDMAFAYQMICDGCTLEEFMEMFNSPLEAIASCARHFIHAPGQMFYDADFVGVEARLTPWIVADKDKLQSILDGVDQYKRVAAMIFNVPYDEVTKAQRTIAKPVELGCCFNVAGKGLQDGLAKAPYYTRISRQEAERIVKVYRKNHPNTVQAWRDMEDAAKAAIKGNETHWVLNRQVAFKCVKTAGLKYLIMRLPSGRRLYYPSPKLEKKWVAYTKEEMAESEWKLKKGGYEREEIRFYGTIPGTNGAKWGFINTYGGRLFENLVQAMGADCLDEGCINAYEKGFEIFMIVHDQSLCYEREDASIGDFEEAFCGVGKWADTFPLAADGQVVPYYLKELD